ncbi:MAG: hypothetical protein KOO60_10770 [Gemmatimonadales bacterium]|nr:hypothetical protein [Gemmatimonadales bacterium]
MERAARKQLHVLLDRVLDANIEEDWAFLRLVRYSGKGGTDIAVGIAGIESSERQPESQFTEAVFRVSVATEEDICPR